MAKFLKYIAVLLAAALVFGAARFLDNGPREKTNRTSDTQTAAAAQTEQQTEESLTETQTEAEEQRILLTFAGDCTLGSQLLHSYTDFGYAKVVGEDYGYPFRNVLEYFETDDFSFVNLEGVLCGEGEAAVGEKSFRGPSDYVKILTENSVEAVSLANDHTLDCGQKGYEITRANLENAGVSYVERDSSTLVTLESGLTIGIYGAMYYMMDAKTVAADIKALNEQADLVIFAAHWGQRNNYLPAQEQTDLAYAAIDAGADIVVGAHPNVLQPIEEYNGGIIYYSLGSFTYGGNIYPEDYDSALIRQEVILAADGTVSLGQTTAVPVCISSRTDWNDYQPVPYAEGSEGYDRVMGKLGLAGKE